ncbi:crustacyanin-A2 subunit isoform X2 [Hyalella azteca]|nr:crustacyanin-A2 subunit isoform X2 [Hyalella azteca]
MTATVALVLVTLQIVSPALGQIIPEFLGFGYCPETPPQADLDLAKFSGTWFTVTRVPNVYDALASCIYTNYTLDADNNLAVQAFGKNAAGEETVVNSAIKSNKPNEPLTVVSTGVPEAPLKIVATDYSTYACLESCLQYVAFKAQFAWVLTKKPASSIEATNICTEIFKNKMGIAASTMKKVTQGRGCEYPSWARGGN